MTSINVVKNSGATEKFDAEKANRVVEWACEGLDVCASEILMKAQIQMFDGVTTKAIHETLIKAASDLISVQNPDYQYAAARLLLFKIRKEAYGDFKPVSLLFQIAKQVDNGKYDRHLLDDYTSEEINYLDGCIRHDRDFDYTYAAMRQYEDKYLVKNRVTGEIYESPQMALMLIAMGLLSQEDKKTRLDRIVDLYENVSLMKVSLPTPIMAGVRTPTRQFSSCVLIESGDDINQIFNANTAQGKYAAQRAGIGLNFGMIRGQDAAIRGGEVKHAGTVPIVRMYQESLGWTSQGGVRKASANYFYPMWHWDFESLIVLKNNRGTESTRARHVDYGLQINKLLYTRLQHGKNITLFHPNVAGGKLYEYFFSDQEKFQQLYEELEADPSVAKKTISAADAFSVFGQERSQTGRIYVQHVDHCNTNSPFDPEQAPVKQSNLCVAPETKILTDEGYVEIHTKEGQVVNVWNGEEFSKTTVVRTGTDQKLVRVKTDSGQELDCTPYHKFYVQRRYVRGSGENRLQIVEVRAGDLKPGDKLIKFDLPVIEGSEELPFAYENGFYSGDGCEVKKGIEQRVYLYHEKQDLLGEFRGKPRISVSETLNRTVVTYGGKLRDKFFVPGVNYSVKSRLEWLAGFSDSDGTVIRNGSSVGVSLSNTNKDFLKEIQLLLQTLGVESKVKLAVEEGMQTLPLNDGSGKGGEFHCQTTYRLTLNGYSLGVLVAQGLKFNRLDISGAGTANRSATHFIKVESVVDKGRVSDTFCFAEPKRHMGMFNGILTGQCMEIALPTHPITDINDPNDPGEVALCTLSAINLGKIEKLEDMREPVRTLVRALDRLLDYQNYPVLAAEKTKLRRTLGIGWTNLAYYLAKRGLKYSDPRSANAVHELAEAFQYYLLEASVDLAKELGKCDLFHETTYSQGILPIDRYKKEVDGLHTAELKMDWEKLRIDIAIHGLRNSTLSTMMPCETSSQITNSTNGFEPPRDAISFKKSGAGMLPVLVPGVGDPSVVYEYKWDMASPIPYLTLVAIMQKFIDQAASANTFYKPWDFPGGKLPIKVVLRDIMWAYKHGLKTLYYQETKDGNDQDEGCDSGACRL